MPSNHRQNNNRSFSSSSYEVNEEGGERKYPRIIEEGLEEDEEELFKSKEEKGK